MCWHDGDHLGVMKVTKEQGKLYNRQRAMGAERQLYAGCRDAGIAALAAKYSAPGIRVETQHPSRRLPMKVQRKLKGAV
jgi:hypothetical protein